MKGKKLSMREIRKILQYRLELQMSAAKTAAILQKSKGVIIETLKRFKASSLTWPLPETLSNTALEEYLYPRLKRPHKNIPLPDLNYIKEEIIKPKMTYQRLFEQYKDTHPIGMSRSRFFRFIRKNQPANVVMRQYHKGGQTLYSDYSGDSLPYTDKETGGVKNTQLFICLKRKICHWQKSYRNHLSQKSRT